MLAHFASDILQNMLGNGCDAKFRPGNWNFRLGVKKIMKKMKYLKISIFFFPPFIETHRSNN